MILDRPPKDWKRPAIPARVKIDVIIIQEGKCKETGEKLGRLENTQFDHRPPVEQRQYDPETGDTIPRANDPEHMEACTIKGHDIRTNGPGGERRITTAGSDTHRRAKIKRLTEPKPDKP